MDDPEIRYLGDVQRLTLSPDDVVVITTTFKVSDVVRAHIVREVKRALKHDNEVLVLEEGMLIGVLGNGETTAT